jgi:hypothetical protein
MTQLGYALRKKYRTPAAALKRLGLDASLLARDALLDHTDPDNIEGTAKNKLAELAAQHLSGAALERFYDLLSLLHAPGESKAEDEEAEELVASDELERRRDAAENFMREKGLSEDDISEIRPEVERTIRDAIRRRGNGRDTPLNKNAMEGGIGGRVGDRRRARARAAAARDSAERWPGAARVVAMDYFGTSAQPMRVTAQDAKASAARWGDIVDRVGVGAR